MKCQQTKSTYLLLIQMSVQAIVPFEINGEKFYTHTSWFSEKQYNAWSSIPVQNKNLALYYSLSAVSLFGIFFRRTALVRSFFSSYGKLLIGVGGSVIGGYIGFLGLLKSQQGSEFNRIVSKNECGSTPLWAKEEAVVNLRQKDYKTFMARRDGRKYNTKDVAGYKPDSVLVGTLLDNKLQKLA